jgi:hypothetical protein
MQVEALIAMLTDGLDPAEAATVRKAIERDAVKAKTANLKQQEEYQAIVDTQTALRQELEGDKAAGKLGAKDYQKWYTDNASAIDAMKNKVAAYESKFGSLDAANPTPNNPASPKALSEEDIQRLVDSRIQGQYAPRWSDLLTSTGTLVQRHMYAKREKPIDFNALSDIAKKYNGDLNLAYDEWDKPERDKAETKSREDEISRRVTEELQKRGANQHFPSNVDSGPSSMSLRTKSEMEKFDKTAFRRDLTDVFMNGEKAN